MKKAIYLLTVMILLTVDMFGQNRQRPRELTNQSSYTGQETFLIDRSDFAAGEFKMLTLAQISSYVLSQGGSGATKLVDLTDIDFTNDQTNYVLKSNGNGTYYFDVDETGSAGASDHKFSINAGDASPNFWDDQIFPGDFIYFDNDGDEVTIEGKAANTAEISSMTNINKIVRPNNLPIFKLQGSPTPANGSTITSNGMFVNRYWNGTQIEWRSGLALYSLDEALSSEIDPYLTYIVIDNDVENQKIKFVELAAALAALSYEIQVIPDWWSVHFSYANTAYDGYTGVLRTNIRVFKNGVEISNTQAANFSVTNVEGITSTSFTRDYDIGDSAYEINFRGTIPSGTYGCDGSVIWSADIVYTDPSTGISVLKSVGLTGPYLTPCDGSTYDETFGAVDATSIMLKIVDDWPTTECQGAYFKLGEGLRFYYIDKSGCQWGYQEYDGATGACMQTK